LYLSSLCSSNTSLRDEESIELTGELLECMSTSSHDMASMGYLTRSIGVGSALASPGRIWRGLRSLVESQEQVDRFYTPAFMHMLGMTPPAQDSGVGGFGLGAIGAGIILGVVRLNPLLFVGTLAARGAMTAWRAFSIARVPVIQEAALALCMELVVNEARELSADEFVFLCDAVSLMEPYLNAPAGQMLEGILGRDHRAHLELLASTNMFGRDEWKEILRMGLEIAHADADYDNTERTKIASLAPLMDMKREAFDDFASEIEQDIFERRKVGRASVLALGQILRDGEGKLGESQALLMDAALVAWIPVHAERVELAEHIRDTFRSDISLKASEVMGDLKVETHGFFSKTFGFARGVSRQERANAICEVVARGLLVEEVWRGCEQHEMRGALDDIISRYGSSHRASRLMERMKEDADALTQLSSDLREFLEESSGSRQTYDTEQLETMRWYKLETLGGGRYGFVMGPARYVWKSSVESFSTFRNEVLEFDEGESPVEVYVQTDAVEDFRRALGGEDALVVIHESSEQGASS
jgi:hypothetical protein